MPNLQSLEDKLQNRKLEKTFTSGYINIYSTNFLSFVLNKMLGNRYLSMRFSE